MIFPCWFRVEPEGELLTTCKPKVYKEVAAISTLEIRREASPKIRLYFCQIAAKSPVSSIPQHSSHLSIQNVFAKLFSPPVALISLLFTKVCRLPCHANHPPHGSSCYPHNSQPTLHTRGRRREPVCGSNWTFDKNRIKSGPNPCSPRRLSRWSWALHSLSFEHGQPHWVALRRRKKYHVCGPELVGVKIRSITN